MIPAMDVLQKIEGIAQHPDVSVCHALAGEVLADFSAGRYYAPDYGDRHAASVVGDRQLGLHVGFLLKVIRARPFKFRAILVQLHQPFTPADGQLLIRMVNRFTVKHASGTGRVDLDHLPVSPTSTGALFVGIRRGEFVPISWIHERLSCGVFACYLQLSVAVYLQEITQRSGRPYY